MPRKQVAFQAAKKTTPLEPLVPLVSTGTKAAVNSKDPTMRLAFATSAYAFPNRGLRLQ